MATRKWFQKVRKTHTGWKKDLPPHVRRIRALRAHRYDYLSAGKSLIAISNVTRDKATKKKARADALAVFKIHKSRKKVFGR